MKHLLALLGIGLAIPAFGQAGSNLAVGSPKHRGTKNQAPRQPDRAGAPRPATPPGASGAKTGAPGAKTARTPEQPAARGLLKQVWRSAFDPAALRIAVADTVGDGHPRVVALSSGGKDSVQLTVWRWTGGAFVAEWSTLLAEAPPLFAVGRFAPGPGPAQIVTSKGLYGWDGHDYVLHPTSRALLPVGVLRRHDGSECFLAREDGDFAVYTVDPAAAGEGWLVPGKALPALSAQGDEIDYGLLRAAPTELEAGIAPEYASSGLLGIWRPRRESAALRFAGRYGGQGADTGASVVLLRDAGGTMTEAWRSAALDGRVVDIAAGDPRGQDGEGLAVLTADSSGKGRALYLFVVDR